MNDVDDVYENQRWIIGLTWTAPIALLDQSPWTDPQGNPVALVDGQNDIYAALEQSREWDVVIDASTDAEGWQYGTVFHHLEQKRSGGRASQRLGDVVRRRLWKRRKDGRRMASTLSASLQDKAFQATHAMESNKKALRAFLKLILDVVSKKKFWELVPWDPGALYIVQKKHSEDYSALRCSDDWCGVDMEQDAPLLQQLIASAVHSRAAYGFAMQAGHIKSVSSYIRLHTLQPLRFDVVGGVSQEANNEAISELTGIPAGEIKQSNWRNSPFRPCYYVAVDRSNSCIVISIRGSLELGDLLSDVAANSIKVSLLGVSGWVHEGIMTSASYIHCCTKELLKSLSEEHPGMSVLVTGHSLGGGVAGMLTLLLRDGGGVPGLGEIRCVTMGSAAAMSFNLAQACDSFAISVVLGSDPVPHISHASLENLMAEFSKASPVKKAAEDFSKSITQLWKSVLQEEEQATATLQLIDENLAQQEQESQEQAPELMYPPGRILWILNEQGTMDSFNKMWENEWSHDVSERDTLELCQGRRVIEVDRSTFAGRILLLPSMFDDHLPDNYLHALKLL